MFGRRRRFLPGHRGGGGGLGLILLGMQLINLFNYFSRHNEFLPVTIGVLAVNLLAYFQPGRYMYHWPNIQQACISVQQVWFQKEWKRILYAPFFHASDFHLYYNMASFIWKGISLEKRFGSGYFLYLIAVFSVVTNLVYLGINFALAEFLDQWSAIQSCAVGFSGVLFALKIVTTHLQPPGTTMVLGLFPVPMRLACWAELILISVLFPNVSFVGHLSGILVGLAWVYGPLRAIMDIPLSALNGTVVLARPYLQVLLSGEYRSVIIACGFLLLLLAFLIETLPAVGGEGGPGRQTGGRSYTYAAGSTGHQPPDERPARRTRPAPQPMPTYTSYTYSSGATGYTDGHAGRREREGMDHGSDEEQELQEAIRRSLSDDRTLLSSGRPRGHTSTLSEARDLEQEDTELQVAQERSIGDSRERHPPPPPSEESLERPPPYNPAFSHSTAAPPTTTRDIGFDVSDGGDLLSSETIPVGWRVPPTVTENADSGSGLVRRRGIRSERDTQSTTSDAGSVEHDSHRGQPGEGLGAESGSLSREQLRAARMQRFGSLTQQRAPLDSSTRRGSWK